MVGVCFFLNVDYDALHLHRGKLKESTFSKYSFEREGVTKKEYSVKAFDVDNSGRPLASLL